MTKKIKLSKEDEIFLEKVAAIFRKEAESLERKYKEIKEKEIVVVKKDYDKLKKDADTVFDRISDEVDNINND